MTVSEETIPLSIVTALTGVMLWFFETLPYGYHNVKIYAAEGLTPTEKRARIETFYQADFDDSPEDYERNDLILSEVLLLGDTISLEEYAANCPDISNENCRMLVCPNPANDELCILNAPAGADVSISNLQGKEFIRKILDEHPIAIGSLPKGVYVVKISQGG